MYSFLKRLFRPLMNNAGTYYTTPLTTPTIATDSLLQRTVADKIRRLYPGCAIMRLVTPGGIKDGDIVAKKGMISKRRVNNRKYERFTYSPAAIEFTVATFTSAASFTLSSADGLRPTYCLLNTANMTVCRIGVISSTTINATTVGSTTFTAAVGDKLLKLAPAYPQNSSAPYLLMKDEDNHFGYTQISRFPVGISASNKEEARFGPDYFSRIKENSLIDGFRTVELSFLFGLKASSGPTTSDSFLSDSFQTADGLWNWAGYSYDAQGNMTGQKFRKNMVLAMGETARGAERQLVAFCGQEFFGVTIEWLMDKLMLNESGKKRDFGVKTERFITSGPTVDLAVHDAFTRGTLVSSMLIFDPDMVEYVFLANRDFKPNNNIQGNDVDGYTDEIAGEWGCDVEDGGAAITKVTNLL